MSPPRWRQDSQQTAREALLCAERELDSVVVLIEQCLAAGALTPAEAATQRAEAVAAISQVQRTQRPAIFPLGSEEGGAGRDKGAGAGTGQKRAAPPSDRDFAAMPAEKRARDDHHGSGSVASDDADATAHRDLHAALDVQGAERCERCGRDFTQWEPQQRPGLPWL